MRGEADCYKNLHIDTKNCLFLYLHFVIIKKLNSGIWVKNPVNSTNFNIKPDGRSLHNPAYAGRVQKLEVTKCDIKPAQSAKRLYQYKNKTATNRFVKN